MPVRSTHITQPLHKKILVFGWYGGKYSHLDWLLPLLPQSQVNHYCEPFSGSGAVLLNREPSPVETYNDLDGEVVTFFRVLRNQADELIRLISLTPFSREEYSDSLVIDTSLPELERARQFYVRARQVRSGMAQSATLGRWANCKDSSRAGMAGNISRWLGGFDDLATVASRLLRVQIENRPAIELIRVYDSPSTLFYCDPPYVHSVRGDTNIYHHEMTDDQHEQFAKLLCSVKGHVAVSNYDCELYDRLFPAPQWRKIIAPSKIAHSIKQSRVEVLWINYDLPKRVPELGHDAFTKT